MDESTPVPFDPSRLIRAQRFLWKDSVNSAELSWSQ